MLVYVRECVGGSYQCYCEVGFYVDGNACTDINECLSNPCEHNCNNTVGSYHCLSNVNPKFSTITPEISSLPLTASVLSPVTTIFIVITCLQTLILILCLISLIIACACMKCKHSKPTPSKGESNEFVDVNELKPVEGKQNKKQQGEYNYFENEETSATLKEASYPAESKDYSESNYSYYANLKDLN